MDEDGELRTCTYTYLHTFTHIDGGVEVGMKVANCARK
jgi:hypothetical protein